MWDTPLRVVKPAVVADGYSPGRINLDPDNGATVLDDEHYVECQPVELAEETAGGTRVHTRTSWRIITPPGTHIDGMEATDGVLVDGIDGVLEVVGEVGGFVHPTHGHDELTVTRWRG